MIWSKVEALGQNSHVAKYDWGGIQNFFIKNLLTVTNVDCHLAFANKGNNIQFLFFPYFSLLFVILRILNVEFG